MLYAGVGNREAALGVLTVGAGAGIIRGGDI